MLPESPGDIMAQMGGVVVTRPVWEVIRDLIRR